MNIEQTANALFSAVEAGDLGALEKIYDPNIQIWHSFTGNTISKDASLERLRQAKWIGRLKYEVLERLIVGHRVIQRHNVHFTSKSGTIYSLWAIVFLTIEGGRITAVEEYVDGGQVKEIFALLD